MTIKQAFEKLTAVTAAAMKNPFFVMRKLHDAFADIADKIEGGGGGGSTVEVTQVVTSGTKIATITVDDTPTDLYAPAASSQDYSTTERVVGKWIDGTTDVYEKTFYANNLQLTDNLYYVVSTDMTSAGINNLVSINGSTKSSDGVYYASLYGIPGVVSWNFGFHINTTGVLLYGTGNQISGGSAVVTLRYTKPTT